MPTVTISLPDSLKGFVERQVNSKGYGNVSEYFRTLLRDAQAKERESNLEALLLEGLNSGPDNTYHNNRENSRAFPGMPS